jgi:hypothetical protein
MGQFPPGIADAALSLERALQEPTLILKPICFQYPGSLKEAFPEFSHIFYPRGCVSSLTLKPVIVEIA